MDMALTPEAPELKSTPELTFPGFTQTEQEFLRVFRELI